MTDEYYVEEPNALPFRALVGMFRQFIPAPFAYALASYFRLRHWLGWPLRPRHGVGPVGSGRIVGRQELSPRTLTRWAPLLEQLGDLGFQLQFYRLGNTIGAKESAAALFLHETGTVFALLEWTRMEGDGIVEHAPLEFDSFCANDPELLTGMLTEEQLELAKHFQLDFVEHEFVSEKMGVRRAFQLHLRRIRDRSPLVFTSASAAAEFERRSKRRFDWLLNNRFFRRLSPSEVDRTRSCRLLDE